MVLVFLQWILEAARAAVFVETEEANADNSGLGLWKVILDQKGVTDYSISVGQARITW